LPANKFRFSHKFDLKDILIVGHGLAGAILSHSLLQAGQRVVVLEGKIPFSASSVAAGIINPLIGPKLNLPPQMGDCLKEAVHFHQFFAEEYAQNHLEKISLRRIFLSGQQREIWKKRQTSSDSTAYTDSIESEAKSSLLGLYSPHGSGVTHAHRLNVQGFLKQSKDILKHKDLWMDAKFDPKDWPPSQKVVFCEGYGVLQNPWFQKLPFEPAQGEVLRVEGPCQVPASNGTWYLPEKENTAYAGSTWNHHQLECGPTERGKRTILENLSYLNIDQYRIVGHASGIRSSTKDRFPILGRHPKISQYHLFNGFGSRGSTTIPFFARQMVDLLTKNIPPSRKACLSRFQT